MAEALGEALAAGNGEKAVSLYWDLVDQAYGKTTTQVELTAQSQYESLSDEELDRRIKEIEAQLARRELEAG